MNIKRVSTREENEAVLKLIEELMDMNPEPKSEDGYELRYLAAICEGYERTIPLISQLTAYKDTLREVVEVLKYWANTEKKTGPWEHGMNCPAEIDITENVVCSCGAWSLIDKTQKALALPLLKELTNG